MKQTKRKPKLIIEDGEPKAVILDIDDYQEILQRLEDSEDLKLLQAMRKKGVKYRRLEEFLSEHNPRV